MHFIQNKLNKNILILFICIIIGGCAGIFLIQTPDFDFYSYHYNSGWSFLNNRLLIDFLPCQQRSYYNPVLDVIDFLLINKLNMHPYIYLFISNLKYGIFLFLTYLISDYVIINNKAKKFGITSILILTLLSPIVIFCMRSYYNDIQIADLALITFYIQIRYIFDADSNKRIKMLALSAFIIGLGIGLKNSLIVFSIPMIITSLIFLKKDKYYIKTLLYMFFCALIGFIITDGWWIYRLWNAFQNPIFPYSNHLFKSPLSDINNYTKTEFQHLMPSNFTEYIFAPLRDTGHQCFIDLEYLYYEPKKVLCFFSVIIIILSTKINTIKNKLIELIDEKVLIIFLIYIIFAYYINSALMGTIRYIIYLFPLSSIVIVVLSMTYTRIIKGKNVYLLTILVALWSFSAFLFIPNTYIVNQRLSNITQFKDNSGIKIEDNSIILCGNQKACSIAPYLNSKSHYIGFTVPQSVRDKIELCMQKMHLENFYYHSSYLENKIKDIFENEKSLYIIFNFSLFPYDKNAYIESIKYYSNDTVINLDKCGNVSFNVLSKEEKYLICKIK